MQSISRLIDPYRTLRTRLQGFPGKKVLVLEGGGMRGIFLVGVLQAFMDRGYFPWHCIIGTSAGALTGAAYAARQIYLARDAFFSDLLSGRFIRVTNIFRREKHILNLDWMVDNFTAQEGGLNLRRLSTTACPVIIVATCFYRHAPLRPLYLDSRRDDVPVALKASAAIPVLYRNFIPYKDEMLMDGSVCDPLPFKKALEKGYKEQDILVVTTRPRGYRKDRESFWVQKLYEAYYKDDQYAFLVTALKDHYNRYNLLLDELEQDHPDIDVIYPPGDFKVNRLSRSEDKILEGFVQGVVAARSYLYPFGEQETLPTD